MFNLDAVAIRHGNKCSVSLRNWQGQFQDIICIDFASIPSQDVLDSLNSILESPLISTGKWIDDSSVILMIKLPETSCDIAEEISAGLTKSGYKVGKRIAVGPSGFLKTRIFSSKIPTPFLAI